MSQELAALFTAEGNLHRQERRLEPAALAFSRALQKDAAHFEAILNLALTLQELGRLKEAEAFYRRAILIAPDTVEAWKFLAFYLHETDRLEEALPAYQRALSLAPDWAEGYLNAGHIYQRQHDAKQAMLYYAEALRHGCTHAAVHVNLGVAFGSLGRHEEALASYARALEIDPSSGAARYNAARSLLALGRWEEAWEGHEFRPTRAALSRPAWQGEPLVGRTILLRAEQGFGDNICWARYVAELKARGATVILETSDPLRRLMAYCRGVDRVVGHASEAGPADFEIALPSLPGLFRTGLATIPASVPYFDVLPWNDAGIKLGAGLKVGLIWESGVVDPKRSCPPGPLWELAGLPGLSLHSLQVGAGVEALRASPFEGRITDLGGAFRDFYDAAQAMQAMDLIISVDTGPAHLACALGRPAWLLLQERPHWLYLLGRSDSPWYPTATLFRQKREGDWSGPLQEVRQRLATMLAGR